MGDVARLGRLLLSQHPDSDRSGGAGLSPLHFAARGGLAGHLRCAEMLLEAGAAVDARSKLEATPLHRAAAAGTMPMIETLCV